MVWGGARGSAPLLSSQMTLQLPVSGPHFEEGRDRTTPQTYTCAACLAVLRSFLSFDRKGASISVPIYCQP